MNLPRIYLAGPDVFCRKPLAVGARKKAICERFDLIGIYPMDHIVLSENMSPTEQGRSISAMSERWMHYCDAMIVNLTPFHGPSMDVGSAYEVGFMRALGKPVFAYSNDDRLFTERIAAFFDNQLSQRDDGSVEDPHHMELENFALIDNLMIDGGIISSGGIIHCQATEDAVRFSCLSAFEQCVEKASKALTHTDRPDNTKPG